MAMWEWVLHVVFVGVVATGVMDIWSMVLRRLGVPTLGYALVGRWLAHALQGRWWHRPIQGSTAIAHERLFGWVAHYALGVVFAFMLCGVAGVHWLRQPTLAPALVFGVASVIVPWCVMQPAMGAGFAAAHTPQPWRARWQSVATHAVFGMGLFMGAWIAA
ncbi:DUF2938 domain-containing protein [Stenotrophomonas sp. Iso1]|uniref:DUF2938 domain-containing protein n=1 Tax=Stenotrophomonas sp. Iso1 TaxID=2977283 RepID=UPI0022B7A544|nr:DUF2938 domain-containing protein [Stenotrophomonas sp. Iso1]